MSSMTPHESIERFSESLKKCASRCRDMAQMQKNPNWLAIAAHFDSLLAKGESFYRQKALSRQQSLEIADRVLANAASDAPKS